MRKNTFLVEIGTEDLPSKILKSLAENFSSNISKELHIAGIFFTKSEWFATSRRLAVKITEVNIKKNNLQKHNIYYLQNISDNENFYIKNINCINLLKKVDNKNLSSEEDKNHLDIKDKKLIEIILFSIVSNALKNLSFFISMRWGSNNFKFIRPVNSITILLNEKLISGNIFNINIDRIIYGHRFMGKQKIRICNADQYPEILLTQGKVIANYIERKNLITLNIKKIEKRISGITDIDNSLLEEITSLVEWPIVLLGKIKYKYTEEIPSEILSFIIKNKQKCFPIYDKNKKLIPYFIFVANIESQKPEKIIFGNERIMYSQIKDAESFFMLDRNKKLEDFLPQLNNMIFQKNLGNLFNRSNRVKNLSKWIAKKIGANVSLAERAGLLSKCDLATKMVFEFTEIQGIIGMYYAIKDGENKDVALAQKEQYYPKFSNDILPTTLISCSLSIANRIDIITGFFGINNFPKGSNDPFALKRSATGIIRIITEKKLLINIQKLVKKSISLYKKKLINKTVENDVIHFLMERYILWNIKKGYNKNVIKSVLKSNFTFLTEIEDKIKAMNYFISMKESIKLINASKRILGIIKNTEHIKNVSYQKFLFRSKEEISLFKYYLILNKKINLLLKDKNYKNIMEELISLCEPIDNFFKNVKIKVEDQKIYFNRISILIKIYELISKISDISIL